MAQDVNLLIGTKKGVFLLQSDAGREAWSVRGPFCEAWPINPVIADPATGVLHAGGGNEWFGPAVWKSADGDATWMPRNKGPRNDYLPEEIRFPDHGQCVHSLVMAPGMPDRLDQQNHCCMYRSDDDGRNWDSVEAGLPSTFGFPAVAHPRDPEALYLVPLNGDSVGRFMPDGQAAVWRTRDGGATWQDLRAGLPQQNAFLGVLRQSLATDTLAPAGI